MNSENDLSPQLDTLQQQQPSSFKSLKPLALFSAILLIALVAGMGGYFLRIRTNKNAAQSTQRISVQPSPTSFIPKTSYPVPSTNPMLTRNWKTYKSLKYSFTFHYPPHIYANILLYPSTMKDKFSDDIVLQTKQISLDDLRNKSEQELKLLYEEATRGDLLVSVRNKDFFEDRYTLDKLKNFWTDYKDESIMVGGKNGRIISGYDYVSSQKKPHIRYIDIPLHQGMHLQIEYYEEAIALDEFNQILSTFKFTNQY